MEKDTYEIWYLGDFWKEGPKNRDTFNEFLIDAGELMYHGTNAGLTVGGIEIFHRSGNDTVTVWDFNFADGNGSKGTRVLTHAESMER